ncbi:alpha/beta hydrolase [Streptomyces sp. NRRL S-350]|uniref:alpha/beta hydrolase n=1 Tax=Streptomyces sp. NRRL S-350 TaxID=1463902 RepID=UPI000A75E9F7|nr:alpha/beta fold hydrolase [Streptomyces sp. NRRL S-350]
MPATPVVFVHGAWFHALCWEAWAHRFAARGFSVLAPGWPGELSTAAEARRSPERLPDLGLRALTGHFAGVVRSSESPPVLVGHSVGGLVVQQLLADGLGLAAVAIASAPVNGVPLPGPLAGRGLPSAGGGQAQVPVSAHRFRQLFANTSDTEGAAELYDRYAVPAPHRLLTEVGGGGPSGLTAVDVGRRARGPLLLVSGQEDRLVPDAVTRAVYKQYGDSTAVTELKQFADRSHTLVVDSGWRSVADHVLDWLGRQGIGADRRRR